MLDDHIDDTFAKEPANKVEHGKATLILKASNNTSNHVAGELGQHNFGGEIVFTNLSSKREPCLRESASNA